MEEWIKHNLITVIGFIFAVGVCYHTLNQISVDDHDLKVDMTSVTKNVSDLTSDVKVLAVQNQQEEKEIDQLQDKIMK